MRRRIGILRRVLGASGLAFELLLVVLAYSFYYYSTTEQGYTVSDCTGEGLKASMYLQFELR